MRLAQLLPLLIGAGLTAQVATSQWTVEQLHEDLDQIAAAIRAQWSYLEDREQNAGVDLDALIRTAKEEATVSRTPKAWGRVLRRLAPALQDGHAQVVVPGDDPNPKRSLPVRFERCVQGFVVTAVTDGADIGVGELITKIDGLELENKLEALAAEMFGSTKGMRMRHALRRAHRTDHSEVTLTITAEAGTRNAKVATRDHDVPSSRPDTENWSLAWPRADIALLRVKSFSVPRWREWLAAPTNEREPFLVEARQRIDAIVDELLAKQAKSLIVDLRGNGGGTDALGIYFAERLLSKPFRYFLLSALSNGQWTRPYGSEYGKGEHPRFVGRLALLVDEGCFSTTDNFARCMQDVHPDCTVIGRPTGAGTGAPRVFLTTKHTRSKFGACTMRVRGPKGDLIEGRGTVPSTRIWWKRDDWILGRDPDLAEALVQLK